MTQPNPTASDVVIIGGGVAGCATAYYLSLAGIQATVIEREGIASQASGFSSGGLNPLEGAQIPGPLSTLAMQSYRMHRELFETLPFETGVDYEGRIVSVIHAALDEAELPALQTSHDLFSAAPAELFSADWLAPEEAVIQEPLLSPKMVKAVRLTGNAALDSYKFTQALADAARKRGASFRSGSVNGLEIANGRVTAVFVGDTKLPCGTVVLATGPWSRQAETWLDMAIPVDPLKGETLRMDMPGLQPLHDLSGGGVSVTPKPSGLVWCGTTEEWRGFDKQPSEAARQSILEKAVRLAPNVANARLVQHTACLRPVTPDWLPIAGKAPGWDNVYLATGAGKKGVLLSPGMGKATADLISQGSTTLPVAACDPRRFSAVGEPRLGSGDGG